MDARLEEDMLDWNEAHGKDVWSLWPTWRNRSTGVIGPYLTETEAKAAALVLILGRREELLRLVLQWPDGSTEELIEERPVVVRIAHA